MSFATADASGEDDFVKSVVGSIRAKAGEPALVGPVREYLLRDFIQAHGLNRLGVFANVVQEHQERLTDVPYALAEGVKQEWIAERWPNDMFVGRLKAAWERWQTDFNDDGADRMQWGEQIRKLEANKSRAAKMLKGLLRQKAFEMFEDSERFGPAWAVCALHQLRSGLNPLECHGPNRAMQVNFAVNEMLKTFERLYDMTVCGGPMFETYFRNAMLLLLESCLEEVTLTELSLVFEDAEYRKFLKARCKNPLVVGFWTNQAERVRGDTALENVGPYIASKVNAFTCNAVIRPIIAQAHGTINFDRVLNGRGIFLARLSKGALGELDTQLLGSFLLSRIFVTALSRTSIKPEHRESFHLYVDEFQNFTNDTVAQMLSEARKYGLCLTLANQSLSQLRARQGLQNVAEAVLGNVGNMVAFRLGPGDAERLHAYTMPEFDGLDLQSLPNFHAVGRLMTTHGPTRPFVFNTLPVVGPRGYALASQAILDARAKACSKPIADVEKQILRRRMIHKDSKDAHCKGETF